MLFLVCCILNQKKENSYHTVTFLSALSEMNDFVYDMEEGEIDWNENFYELYKANINFLKSRCEIISKEEEL